MSFLSELGGVVRGETSPLEGAVGAGAAWLDERSRSKQEAQDRKAVQVTAQLNAQTAQANTKTTLYIVAGAVVALVVLVLVFRRKG